MVGLIFPPGFPFANFLVREIETFGLLQASVPREPQANPTADVIDTTFFTVGVAPESGSTEAPWGSPGGPFGSPWGSPELQWGSPGVPLGSPGLPLAPLGSLGLPWGPLASPGVPDGPLRSPAGVPRLR